MVQCSSMINRKMGKVIKFSGLNVWPHEMWEADILAAHGHIVEFIPISNNEYETTPDVLIDGEKWEIKSPQGSLKSVERNLKKARWQSDSILFVSKRMKQIPDKAIERELRKWSNEINNIRRVKFINRRSKIVDIKT